MMAQMGQPAAQGGGGGAGGVGGGGAPAGPKVQRPAKPRQPDVAAGQQRNNLFKNGGGDGGFDGLIMGLLQHGRMPEVTKALKPERQGDVGSTHEEEQGGGGWDSLMRAANAFAELEEAEARRVWDMCVRGGKAIEEFRRNAEHRETAQSEQERRCDTAAPSWIQDLGVSSHQRKGEM
jgi:hypothetical protein